MINYKLFKDHGLTIKSIRKKGNSYIINTNNGMFAVKEKSIDLDSKFNYLLSRGFNYFPEHFTIDNYEVFKYIEDSNISFEEKLMELITLTSLLHSKTTRYKESDIDDYKEIYENLKSKIEDLNNYYINLNNEIDNDIYMSPSRYLLVLNISKIYSALAFCNRELDNFYEIVKNKDKKRVVFTHNNLNTDHLLYSDKPYLISFNKSKIDLPIYDLIDLYKKYYKDIDFSILLNTYQKKYPLSSDELMLFFIIISIPDKIEFKDNEFLNIKSIKKVLESLSKSDKIIRNFYKNKTKETN